MASSLGTSMSILDAIYSRRSIRAYAPRPIDRETVRVLLTAAVQAPTATQEEAWLFAVVQDRAVLSRWSAKAKSMMRGDAEHAQLLRNRTASATELLADPGFNVFFDAGTLIVIAAKTKRPFAIIDCWLAAQNLMLAAAGMGLGTCCVAAAAPALNTPEIKAELSLPAGAVAVVPIVVGQPSQLVPPVRRKPPAIIHWR